MTTIEELMEDLFGGAPTARNPSRRKIAREAYEDHIERERLEALRSLHAPELPMDDYEAWERGDCDRRRIGALIVRLERDWMDLECAVIVRLSNTIKTIAWRHCRGQEARLEVPTGLQSLTTAWRLLGKGRATWVDVWIAANMLSMMYGGEGDEFPCGDQ